MTTDSSTGDWTPERIREARERCERATPGPWEASYAYNNGGMPTGDFKIPGHNGGATVEMLVDDAYFCAHARKDLPAALDEIERLTAELAARAPADTSLEARAEEAARVRWVALGPMVYPTWDELPAREKSRQTALMMSVVRAVDTSRPGLTEEQAAAWAREMAETNEPGWEPNAAALLRASRGETGPAPSKPAKESDDAPDSGHDDTALTAEQYDRHKARIASGEIPGGAPTTHTVDFGCARPTHAGPEATCSLCHPAPEAP